MPLFEQQPTRSAPKQPRPEVIHQRSSGNPDFDDLDRLKEDLAQANYDLREAGENFARKKHAFHAAKAKAFVNVVGAKNADERNARAFGSYSNEMLDAELAEAERDAALELVRSLRQMLSAVQTKIAASRAEANALHYGQGYGA
jgi:hypothetical protein